MLARWVPCPAALGGGGDRPAPSPATHHTHLPTPCTRALPPRQDTWCVTLRNSIKASFKDVGKGWFNLHESNMETYEFSKLRKVGGAELLVEGPDVP